MASCLGVWAAGRVGAQAAFATPHGFISTRYGSATSSVLLVGYTVGPVTPMVALVDDPHSDYREELAGVLRTERVSAQFGVTYGVAGAKADEAWYAQLWFAPSLMLGRVRSDARLKTYFPLESAGTRELTLNPGSVVVDLSHRVAVGVAAVWVTAEGWPAELGAGPRVGVRIPKGSITLDGLLGVREWENEVRVSFYTTY